MSINITAKWDTAKGHGFTEGQPILLFGFDGNGQWDKEGQKVTVHRKGNRVVLMATGKGGQGKQVWAGGAASKFWATPAPEKAPAKKEAPKVETPGGVELRTSGKHGLKEGSVFLFHGDDKKAPAKQGRKLTLRIVDRVWITGGWTPRARSR